MKEAPAPASLPPSVLVVDDDPHGLVALKAALAPLGLRVAGAPSGRDALRLLLKERFDLIVLDVRMPNLDGFETAAMIRQRAATATTPIIFVSAFSQAEADVARGYGLGAIDFVTSPIVPAVLRAKVQAIAALEADKTRLLGLIAGAREEAAIASEFLSIAAHEIRRPLTVIGGYLSMLVDGSVAAGSAAGRKVLEGLFVKTEEADRLLTDLLLAAKAEFPRNAEATVDINTFARLACERAQSRASLIGSGIDFQGLDRTLEARADSADIGRILDNLIGNALSYSPPEAVVQVRVIDADTARVEIEDHGRGVPVELRERIFEPFFRIASGDPAPGSGLGLYLSRKLAGRYLGTVELLESKADRGSTFTLSLPGSRASLSALPPERP